MGLSWCPYEDRVVRPENSSSRRCEEHLQVKFEVSNTLSDFPNQTESDCSDSSHGPLCEKGRRADQERERGPEDHPFKLEEKYSSPSR